MMASARFERADHIRQAIAHALIVVNKAATAAAFVAIDVEVLQPDRTITKAGIVCSYVVHPDSAEAGSGEPRVPRRARCRIAASSTDGEMDIRRPLPFPFPQKMVAGFLAPAGKARTARIELRGWSRKSLGASNRSALSSPLRWRKRMSRSIVRSAVPGKVAGKIFEWNFR